MGDERDGAADPENTDRAPWNAGTDDTPATGSPGSAWQQSSAIGRAEVRSPYADLLPQPEQIPHQGTNGAPVNGSRFGVPPQYAPADPPSYEPRYDHTRHEPPNYFTPVRDVEPTEPQAAPPWSAPPAPSQSGTPPAQVPDEYGYRPQPTGYARHAGEETDPPWAPPRFDEAPQREDSAPYYPEQHYPEQHYPEQPSRYVAPAPRVPEPRQAEPPRRVPERPSVEPPYPEAPQYAEPQYAGPPPQYAGPPQYTEPRYTEPPRYAEPPQYAEPPPRYAGPPQYAERPVSPPEPSRSELPPRPAPPPEPPRSALAHEPPRPAHEPPRTMPAAAPRPPEVNAPWVDPVRYGSAGLPLRVPAEPDVPEVPEAVAHEPIADGPPAETPELTRIASYLRDEDEEADPVRPDGFDIPAVLAAVRDVVGVREATLRPNPGGVHTLRLELADDADPGQVSREVARLLKVRMGLAAEPNESAPRARNAPAVLNPPRRHRTAATAGSGRLTAYPRPDAPDPDAPGNQPPRPLPGGAGGPRVVLDQVEVSTQGTDALVEVRLSADGARSFGVASGPAFDGYVLRLAAIAAANAVDELLTDPIGGQLRGRCFIEHATVVPLGNCEVAVVVLLLACGGWVEQLVGSAVVGTDPRQAVVRATLAAVNRRVEALLP